MTMEQVLKALAPDEPNYKVAARELGAAAIPFLIELARSPDALLAGKAASLAALITDGEASKVLEVAAMHASIGPRAAAAYGARYLSSHDGERIALILMDDAEVAVAKFAIRSSVNIATPALKQKLESLAADGKGYLAEEAQNAIKLMH